MASITFLGGVNEVGGTKIHLEDRDTSIFIDWGKSYTLYKQFYNELNRPRGFGDYLATKQVPKMAGIYRRDLIEDARKKSYDVPPLHDEPDVDALFISHSHTDHFGYAAFLDERIPIICSRPTYQAIEAFVMVSKRSLETEITSFREVHDTERKIIFQNLPFPAPTKKEPDRKPTHYRMMVQKRIPPPPRTRNFILHGTSIGSVEIELYQVDHSIHDTYGCIVHMSDASIVYTSDIRFHGPDSRKSFEFVEKAKAEKPDILIVDGTRIHEEETMTEKDIELYSKDIVEKTKGLTFVNFPYRNIRRLETFENVAKATNRAFVSSRRCAAYWKYFKGPFPLILDGLLMYEEKTKSTMRAEPPKSVKVVEDKEIRSHPDKYLVHAFYYDFEKIIDLQPLSNSTMILSISEPHDEEGEVEMGKIANWCNYFGLHQHYTHSSGHMNGQDLTRIVNEINPRIILPIHCKLENAILIKEKFPDRTKILKEGQRFEVREAKITDYA